MSDSVREAFSQHVTQAIVKCGPNHLTDTFVKQVHAIAWEAHQAATAEANAEWRGVVEKLVGATTLATEQPILAGTVTQQILLEALAQAATAIADAEWRGVVVKLVATVQAYEAKTYGGWIVGQSKQPHELASDALAQAEQLMGRK